MLDEKYSRSLERSEIEEQYKWAIDKLYGNDGLWEEDFKRAKTLIQEFIGFQGKLIDAKTLLRSLDHYEALFALIYKLYSYANIKMDEDNRNSQYQALADRGQSLLVETESAVSFYIPELLQLSEEEMTVFYKEERGLDKYKHFLSDVFRQKAHVRSVEEEQLLAQLGEVAQTAQNIFGMLNNADIKFPEIENESNERIEVTKENFVQLLISPDRRVRHDAFKALYGVYHQYRNTFASALISNIKKNTFYAKAKKYESPRAAALFGSNIPIEVYDNLVATINRSLPLMHRYVSIRKRLMGLEELHMYDLYVPVVKDVQLKYSYEEAQELLAKGLSPLGEAYIGIMKEGFANRWVDVFQNKGKTGGAYSWGTYDAYPFILMNYNGTINHVFTLAHEMGHSLHSYYTAENQPFIYSNYKTFVAEVASTVNEGILMDYMIKASDDPKLKMYLINHYLEQFRGTVFRQTMFAEFEKITHELVEKGEALTADRLSSIYHDLNVKYHGNDMVVDEEIDIEWARIPHFYNSFYVYQYATGYSAAVALSKRILQKEEGALESYLGFLKSGDSDYSINVLKRAGVDMTSEAPIVAAMTVFESLLDELEALAEK